MAVFKCQMKLSYTNCIFFCFNTLFLPTKEICVLKHFAIFQRSKGTLSGQKKMNTINKMLVEKLLGKKLEVAFITENCGREVLFL